MRTDEAHTKLGCPYCGATENLRISVQDPWGRIHEVICEDDFTATDDGPCFDDLSVYEPSVNLLDAVIAACAVEA